MGARGGVLAVMCLLWFGCGSDEEPGICDATELADALANARSGETVRVGSCRVLGSFSVPAGVTLAGDGRDASVIEGPAGGQDPVVRLAPSDPPARLRDLAIESAGPFAIGAAGTGAIEIEEVRVNASSGIGLGAEDVSLVTMTGVDLTGPITLGNADAPPEDAATLGLALVRVADATLADVTITGFAEMGAAIVDGSTRWEGGGAPANLHVGLLVSGGTADLTGLDLGRTIAQGLRTTASGVFRSGAEVRSGGLRIEASEEIGLLHDDASAEHADLVATDNGWAALWVQSSSHFVLSGPDTLLSGNHNSGLTVLDSSDVTVTDAEIADTIEETSPVSVGGRQFNADVGDGIALAWSTELQQVAMSVKVEGVSLSNNARVGLILELGDRPYSGIELEDVTTAGTGDQLGVIAQSGDIPDGWDEGVARDATTDANDAADAEPRGVAQVMDPDFLPNGEAVAAGLGL